MSLSRVLEPGVWRFHAVRLLKCRSRSIVALQSRRQLTTQTQPASTQSDLVERVASQPINPLSIKEIIKLHDGDLDLSDFRSSSKRLEDRVLFSARWTQQEIPIRLAHRLHDFNRLPWIVVSNEHVHQTYGLYCKAFTVLHQFQSIETLLQAEEFTRALQQIVAEHKRVLPLMQKGIAALQVSHPDLHLDSFLRKLFGTRIGNRVLSENHLALFQSFTNSVATDAHPTPSKNNNSNFDFQSSTEESFVGVIDKRCKPSDILATVAQRVERMTLQTYGVAPTVQLTGESDIEFPYVPEHLRFICSELMKNSMRATVEHHHAVHGVDKALPPVTVGVFGGDSHVFIKLSDQGGGIPSDIVDFVWRFGYSTAQAVPDVFPESDRENLRPSAWGFRMAGYGFGLPLSKLYANYFGGDLDVKVMPGYGCDTYILLCRLGLQRESETVLHNASTIPNGLQVTNGELAS